MSTLLHFQRTVRFSADPVYTKLLCTGVIDNFVTLKVSVQDH